MSFKRCSFSKMKARTLVVFSCLAGASADIVGLWMASSNSSTATPVLIDNAGKIYQRLPPLSTPGGSVATGTLNCVRNNCYFATMAESGVGATVFGITLGFDKPDWTQSVDGSIIPTMELSANDTLLAVVVGGGKKRICGVAHDGVQCYADFSQYNGLAYGSGSALCRSTDTMYVALHTSAAEPDVLVPFNFAENKLYAPIPLAHGAPNGLTCDESQGKPRIVGWKYESNTNSLWYAAIDLSSGQFTTLQDVPMPANDAVDTDGVWDVSAGLYIGSLLSPTTGNSSIAVTDFHSAPAYTQAGGYIAGVSTTHA